MGNRECKFRIENSMRTENLKFKNYFYLSPEITL